MSAVPEVSIIIPVYNGERYLRETVIAVLKQSFQSFEIWIVNDGSTDDTKSIALDLQAEDNRIHYLEKENTGVSATRNVGLSKAQGKYVVFLDADDMMEPEFLQCRMTYLSQHDEVGCCGAEIRLIDGNGQTIPDAANMRAPGEKLLEEVLFYESGIATIPANLMVRRELLVNNHICFDTRLSSTADRFFLCKLALITQCRSLPGVSLAYRVHSGSMYHDKRRAKAIFNDNELYVKLLIQEGIVPQQLREMFLKKNYYMLCGAALKAGLYAKAWVYGLKYGLTRLKY